MHRQMRGREWWSTPPPQEPSFLRAICGIGSETPVRSAGGFTNASYISGFISYRPTNSSALGMYSVERTDARASFL